MRSRVRTIALFVAAAVLLPTGVIVINQTAQVVQLASTVHPTLGTATLGTLLAAYTGALVVPLALYLRLPKPLLPPESTDTPEYDAYLDALRGRLAGSPHLAGVDLTGRVGIQSALQVLDAKADAIAREAAMAVFLSTAVSQSGRLDGVLVLAAQSRMVWRIAHLYRQRPAPSELIRLYAAVGATVFVATELNDIDLSEQVEPILTSALGAMGANIPGFQVAGAILANCVLSGSANAFLTLRVGMITKKYCDATVTPRRALLRRAATLEAARALSRVVSEGTAKLTSALWKGSVAKVGDASSRVWDKFTSGFFTAKPSAADVPSA
jgi:hypothetical protein